MPEENLPLENVHQNPETPSGDCGAMPCSPLLTAYSRDEILEKLDAWTERRKILDDDGDIHPQCAVNHGIIRAFLMDHFPVENA